MLAAMAPLPDHQAAQRSLLITELVGQLKRGQITKAQLYHKLRDLGPERTAAPTQSHERNADQTSDVHNQSGYATEGLPAPLLVKEAGAEAPSPMASRSPQFGSEHHSFSGGGLTGQDRRAIIRRLIEEKRRRAAAAAALAAAAAAPAAAPALPPPRDTNGMQLPPPALHSYDPYTEAQQHGASYHGEGTGAGRIGPPLAPGRTPLYPYDDNDNNGQPSPQAGANDTGEAWHDGSFAAGGVRDGSELGTNGSGRGRPPYVRRRGSSENGGGGGQYGEYAEGGDGGGGGGGGGPIDDSAYRFRSFSEERARRSEEIVRRELMSECTFRPRIKGLPQSYGAMRNADVPFLQRVGQWQENKQLGAERRRAHGDDSELEGCTFAPTINANSRRAAAWRLEDAGEADVPVDDRLYEEWRQRRQDRQRLERSVREREEEELERSCTFQPSLVTSPASGAPAVQSRYRALAGLEQRQGGGCGDSDGDNDGGGEEGGGGGGGGVDGSFHYRVRPRPAPPARKDCTFKPVVIGARGDMPSARLYLQLNVVDRLTGAHLQDTAAGTAGASGGGGGRRREGGGDGSGMEDDFGYLDGLGGDGDDGRGGGGGGGNRENPEDRPSFREFLARQNQSVVRRQRLIEHLSARAAPPFRPELCPGSRRLHDANNRGDFLQRVARDAIRKGQEAVRMEARRKGQEPTFQPEVTSRSKAMPSRTPVQMSRGDQLRRETAQRLAKLRAEQERLTDMTFQPALNCDYHGGGGGGSGATQAQGKLRVISEPALYVKRVQVQQLKKDEAVRRRALEREAQEVAGCTFRPETTPCPSYIRRIARSTAAARAAAPAEPALTKPEWR
ncbi:unnamed protein product [Phaeothamnion confervicola]